MASSNQFMAVNRDRNETFVSGVQSRAELEALHQAGVSYAGFIFMLTSPYGISIQKGIEIGYNSPIPLVAIFQNADLEEILYVTEHLHVSAVLLNGWETQAFISELRENLPSNIRIIKIAHMDDENPKMDYQDVDFYLLGGRIGERVELNESLLSRIDLSNVFVSLNFEIKALDWPNRSLSEIDFVSLPPKKRALLC